MNKQKHTPRPWKAIGGKDFDGKKEIVIRGHIEGRIMRIANTWIEANAHLIVAACNSYDKHCGERAIECAEGDLLGELLEVCKKGLITIRELNDGHPLRVMEEMDAAIAKGGLP